MLFSERADRQIRGDQSRGKDAGRRWEFRSIGIRRFHVLAEEPAEIFRLLLETTSASFA